MINLADKYEKQIAAVFAAASFVQNNTNKNFTWAGVKSLTVMTPLTQDLVDYKREGTLRYGDPKEMQDTVQEMSMSQDKSFAMTIDKGNLNDQQMLKKAGEMLSLEKKEKVVPLIDKYTLYRWVTLAGTIAGAAALTKSNIVERISAAETALTNLLVPSNGRVLYITADAYQFLRLAPEMLPLERLGTKALAKGQVGEIMDMMVIRVPRSYLPADCHYLITYPQSVIQATKIAEAKFHTDPPGISGSLLEGRYYYDAFVLAAKADGVYAEVDTSAVSAAPTIAIAGGNATITGTGVMRYTIDGSDPRYSKNAFTYTAAVPVSTGTVVKAVATATGKYASPVIAQAA